MYRWRVPLLPIHCLVASLGLSVPTGGQSAQVKRLVGASDPSTGCALRIHVDGLRSSRGVIGSVIFRSNDGWPEDTHKAYRAGPTPIQPGAQQTTVVWQNIPAGDYGLAVIHDENRNAHLDRNLLGIPKEDFGFANNPHVGLSAPSFQAALVHVQCPVTDTLIHLQHK